MGPMPMKQDGVPAGCMRFNVALYQARLESLESFLGSNPYAGEYELALCWGVSLSAAIATMHKIMVGIRAGILQSKFPINGKKIGVKGNYYVVYKA